MDDKLVPGYATFMLKSNLPFRYVPLVLARNKSSGILAGTGEFGEVFCSLGRVIENITDCVGM